MKCKNKTDLGEGMELIQEDFFGWWKPRYLIDNLSGTQIEFMSVGEQFCTVTVDDIDWESLSSLDDVCKQRAKELDIHFPTLVSSFHNGVARVSWQLNPDGRYYSDDDGFGMTNDVEVEIYGFIDRSGKVISKFRHVAKNWKLIDEMRAEAEAVVKARKG